MNDNISTLEKSKFEIENPELFEQYMEKTMPKNPDPNNLPKPKMTRGELKSIFEHINKDTIMLEVGGGGSSVYWTRYVKKLVVVEPSKTISNRILETLSKIPKMADIEMHCILPNFQQKQLSVSAKPGQFDNMIKFISEMENDKFDLAFIDGRDRVRSFEACIHSIKIGGIIAIHDFWDRKKYHTLLENKYVQAINSIDVYTKYKNRLGLFKRIS